MSEEKLALTISWFGGLAFLGLSEKDRGLIRIHCGLEGADILIEDLEQALN